MRRRLLLQSAGVAFSSPAFGQKLPRVGMLIAGDAEPARGMFKKAMEALGYVDGRNAIYEVRATGAAGKLDEHTAELVRLKVDVLVAVNTPAVTAARRATGAIPIVFSGSAPSVGLVKNFARPEGNLTGVFGAGAALAAKSLQLFREMKPSMKSFSVLLNSSDPFHAVLAQSMVDAARAEKVELIEARLKSGAEMGNAFQVLARRGVDGALVQPTLGLADAAALALRHRVPAISIRREFAEAGGLFGYSPDWPALNGVLASYVDRILKGARVADLPIQQTTRFELVINQKTATALGIVLPSTFLARADEVIE